MEMFGAGKEPAEACVRARLQISAEYEPFAYGIFGVFIEPA